MCLDQNMGKYGKIDEEDPLIKFAHIILKELLTVQTRNGLQVA